MAAVVPAAAGQGEGGAPGVDGQDGPVPDIYPENLAYNAKQIYFLRSTALSLAGASAGVLGLRNLSGFYFFAVTLLLTNLVLLAYNARAQPSKYVPHLGTIATQPGVVGLAVQGGQENLFSYVLWWTFWYGIVHVYD
ncbi:unnamed protein product [Tilletia controversa]|uniref:ER membrane protein complex subunit 6 n=3 Tax=Tilletia TaxID=13289 RepID=A0A8X7MZC3_9BASI|nr:hypothetical protein CF336_g5209 [Tilletia laevis]KAE8203853.1 hypothetical protein CF328_g1421 [Tilletia controversa]KAE8258078.1 hypothetical protein A4X03_0g4490 [Tilletia caries]KAE8197674.1 hypothetical protein CF335_g4560 [Tilletia laevis]KAE8253323.1 hypothetical protein A4X06_0g1533 [Tilletia controversa]